MRTDYVVEHNIRNKNRMILRNRSIGLNLQSESTSTSLLIQQHNKGHHGNLKILYYKISKYHANHEPFWLYNGYVAIYLPELFYSNHTCILTAYWEGSPSRYYPWAATHLAQQCCCHCWKQFWNSIFFLCLQYSKIFIPFRETLFL
jgi:hypothetical protein